MSNGDSVILTHAAVVGPDSVKHDQEVTVVDGRIADIRPSGSRVSPVGKDGEAVHDLGGAFLMPGMIDIHSDAIETILQPRPTSIMDLDIAFMEHEKQLLNQGITTMYHSLSLMQKGAMRDKEARKPHLMKQIVAMINAHGRRKHLIRHRFHCRFDLRNLSGVETLLNYIENDWVHLLSFIDHTPGQGQYRDIPNYRETMKKYHPTYTDEQITDMIEEKMAHPILEAEMVDRIASLARQKGIPIASHDDDSEEKLAYVQEQLSVGISEFPVGLDIARKAKERGMLTVAGAPNVLLGRSHSGNVSATEAILDGCCDILCSDYFPPSMLHAVFKLNREHGLTLPEAVKLVTLNPARALGIDDDFGSIQAGKRADLLAIEVDDGRPMITRVFIGGKLVSALNYRSTVHCA